ncbi:unnamed protein product [[Candida] boidinii]|nr:unnamed protein product [[Candida] boidinii]
MILELNNNAIKIIFCFQKLLDSNYNGDGDVSIVKILSYIKTKLNLKTPTSSLKYKNNTKEDTNPSSLNVGSPFVSAASAAGIANSSSLSTPNSFKRNSNGMQIGNGYSMDNSIPQTSLFRSDSTSTSNSIIGTTTDVKTLFPSNGSKSVPLTSTRNRNDSISTLNAGYSVNETNSMNNTNDKNISSALMGHSNSNLFDDLSAFQETPTNASLASLEDRSGNNKGNFINGIMNANSRTIHKGQYGAANKRHKSSSSDISSPVSSACSNSSVFTQSMFPSCTISRTPSVSTHNGNGHYINNNGNSNGNTSNSNNNINNNTSNQRRTSVSSNSSINSNYPPVSLFASSTAGNSFQNNGTNGANSNNNSNVSNGFNEPGRRKRTTTVSSGIGPHEQVTYNDSNPRMNSISSSASTNSSSIIQLKQNQRSSNGQKSLFETFNQSINGSLNNGLRKVRTERSRSVAVPHVQPPITDPEITHSRTQSLSIHTPSNFLCDEGQFTSDLISIRKLTIHPIL